MNRNRRARRPLRSVARSFLRRPTRRRVLLLASLEAAPNQSVHRALKRAAHQMGISLDAESSPETPDVSIRLLDLGSLSAPSLAALVQPDFEVGPDVLLVSLPAPVDRLSVQYRLGLWVWSTRPRFVRCLVYDADVDIARLKASLTEAVAHLSPDPPSIEVLRGGNLDGEALTGLMMRVLQSLVAASGRGGRADGARRLQERG